ncbi:MULTISPECIES: LysR family transcriptional regulator [unclassified Sphingobium]|uniref:LysR family transcriptional regulator n=1 Tax=unclassified Sphingobium TaxID=2611147 RepID=UPI0022245D52|nr:MULTISPECIES: LysR family transcriptional regulator [unclassified Sphingobium]MCW2395344.1 DNA-binding transcriptional LysR family regulator [Sphingobium sp. B8D3B]MCW2418859.1 DNA-binding transcriptional LysR family regulator [Sphingobium sp. B8D3C]
MMSALQSLPFTLRQLVIFETLAETRSFAGSAELLGISQASVSSQFKALEAQLGVALMARSAGRRPELTPEGERFLADLRIFSSAADQLAAHRLRRPGPREIVRFRILLGQGLADHYVRPRLDRFLAAHPHIVLEFDTRIPSHESTLAASSGTYDFVLIHQPADEPVAEAMRSLGRVSGGIFGNRKLAAGREVPLSPAEVARLPFALPSGRDDGAEQRLRRKLASFGVQPTNIVARVQFFDVIIAMVARGQAVANLPAAMIPPDMRGRIVRLFPLHDWRLVFHRRDAEAQADRDAVERLLLESVVKNRAYGLMPD